jgi:hypothetical protein
VGDEDELGLLALSRRLVVTADVALVERRIDLVEGQKGWA